jgi:hypothetical protein
MIRIAILAFVLVANVPSCFAAQMAEQEIDGLQDQLTGTVRPATERLRGTIHSVDQRHDTINIRLSSGPIEQLKVQDGLIFDAIRYGEQLEVSVQTIAGAKTIVSVED